MENTEKINDIRHERNPQTLHNGIDFFTETVTAKEEVVSPHIHQLVEIMYVESGSMVVVSDDIEETVVEGSTVLFRANSVHSIFPITDNCTFSVLFLSIPFIISLAYIEDGALYAKLLTRFHTENKTFYSPSESKKLKLDRAFDDLKSSNADNGFARDVFMKAHASYIISAILRNLSEQDNADEVLADNSESLTKKINDAVLYINEHFGEDLTVASMAERLFMSYSYFSRNFKRVTGRCFKDFLNITRINHAEMKLRSTAKSVTQIAMECGYNNIAYFSAMYKKLKGISPTAARENIT